MTDFEINPNLIKRVNEIASWSKANKRKVGALLTIDNKTELTNGFNKIPCQLENAKTYKCENSEGLTYPYVIHAEELAITRFLKTFIYKNIKSENRQLILYCTYSPCYNCCKLIIQAGITDVVYINEHPKDFKTPLVNGGLSPEEILNNAGINVIKYNKDFKRYAIVHHDKDNDGFMSAFLCSEFIKAQKGKDCHIEFIGYNYEEYEENNGRVEWMNPKNFNDYDYYFFTDITPSLKWLESVYYKIICKEKVPNSTGDYMIKIIDHHYDGIEQIRNFCNNTNIELFKHILLPHITPTNESSACKIMLDEITNDNTIKDKFIENNQHINFHILSLLVHYMDLYDTWRFETSNISEIEHKTTLAINEYYRESEDIISFIKRITLFCDNVDSFEKSIYFGLEIIKLKEKEVIERLKNSHDFYMGDLQCVIVEGNPDYYFQKYLKSNTPNIKCLFAFKIPEDNPNVVKVSVRTWNTPKHQQAINMAKHFGGGGHPDAASFNIKSELLSDEVTLINAVKAFIINGK